MLLRDPTPADFARFSTYTNRVKMFHRDDRVPTFYGYQISSDLWTAVLRHSPKPLFPNLQRLQHVETDYDYRREHILERGPVYLSELFCGPGLKEADIDYGGWPSDERRPTELVRAMAHASPRMEDLELSAGVGIHTRLRRHEAASLSCPEIVQLHHLVRLSAFTVYVAPAALVGLASLPRLRELLLHVNPEEYDWDDLRHARKRCGISFPALEDLELYEISLEWCVAFMHTVTSSSLWRVKVDGRGGTTVPSILLEALCASLAENPSQDTIQVLSINIGPGCNTKTVKRSSEKGFVFQKTALVEIHHPHPIVPLLSLSALRWLALGRTCQAIADDAVLDAMTWAWPNLESLAFCWPDGPGYRLEDVAYYPQATFYGVLLLARHCPRLTTLELAVDMRCIPDFDAWRWGPPVALCADDAPPLKSFELAGSVFRESDALPVAAFLSLVFPHLHTLGSPFGTTWPEMEALYRKFLAVRRQERDPALRPRRGRPRERQPYIP